MAEKGSLVFPSKDEKLDNNMYTGINLLELVIRLVYVRTTVSRSFVYLLNVYLQVLLIIIIDNTFYHHCCRFNIFVSRCDWK